MFKEALPGIAAFLFLAAFAAASVIGFRLYQVSTAANELLTGNCSVVQEATVEALEKKVRIDVTADLKKEFELKELKALKELE